MGHFLISFSWGDDKTTSQTLKVAALSPEEACKRVKITAGGNVQINTLQRLGSEPPSLKPPPNDDVLDIIDPNPPDHED